MQSYITTVFKPEEAEHLLSISSSVLEHLIRTKQIRAWVYHDTYRDYYPITYDCWLVLAESANKSLVIDADLDLSGTDSRIETFNRTRGSFPYPKVSLQNIRYEEVELRRLIPDKFSFDHLFTSLRLGDKEYCDLSKTKSAIIQQLWTNYLLGRNGLSDADLYSVSPLSAILDKRVANSFKGDELLGTLIIRDVATSKYRLNFGFLVPTS